MIYESGSNTIIKNIWDWDIIDISRSVYDILQIYKNINVVINCIGEHELDSLKNTNLHKLNTLLGESNSKLYFIFGTYQEYLNQYKNIIFIEVPTYFLTNYEFTKYDEQQKNQNYFFSLINRPHIHRCIFIDSIYKNGLQKYLNFSWNIKTENFLDEQYQFEYWHERISQFDDGYISGNDNILPPSEYLKTSIDIVLESTPNKLFYTEKTKRPIYYKKPFIIVGAQHINKKLKDFGFQIFDKIIDYKFDNFKSYEDRIKSLIEQLLILKDYDLDYLNQKTKKKVNHNFENLEHLKTHNRYNTNLKNKLKFIDTERVVNKMKNTFQLVELIKNE